MFERVYARDTAAFAVVSREMECLGIRTQFPNIRDIQVRENRSLIFVDSKAGADDGVAFRLVN